MAKILIADDSETLRVQLRNDLEAANHEVLAAEDGLVAIKRLQENPDVQLCILDVNMPEASGLEVLEKMREENLCPKALVFMLTTDSSPVLKEKGKSLGVKAWITKPYQKESLLNVIEKLVV
jgi:two-component system chemotaxis response regulator CheY